MTAPYFEICRNSLSRQYVSCNMRCFPEKSSGVHKLLRRIRLLCKKYKFGGNFFTYFILI